MRLSRLPSREFHSGRYHRAATTAYFTVKMKKNDAGKWRAGIVAGAAVHKSAAKRNFWKRQTKETLQSFLSAMEITDGGGRDILIILSPNINALTKKQFRGKLKAAVRGSARTTPL